MAGGKDAFVSEKSLKESYKRVGSRDKRLAIFSRKNGYSADYGHSDVLIGKGSAKEVYPVILKWLDRRTTLSSIRRSLLWFRGRIIGYLRALLLRQVPQL
jgi:hypothetical protein